MCRGLKEQQLHKQGEEMKMRQLTGWHRWMGVMLIFLGLSGAAWAAEDEDPEPTPEQIEATRQAAKKGNAEAQYALGTCYMMGKGLCRKPGLQGSQAAWTGSLSRQLKPGNPYDRSFNGR